MLYLKLNDVLQQLKAFFDDISEIEEVYLFGSVAKGNHLPWSDIDLLVLSKNPRKISSLISSFLDEIFVKQGILISVIFQDINNRSIVSRQFQKEGKLIWAKKNSS
jgi:predicted nucleotidyltransferase